MQGVSDPPTQRGIIPRAFEHIFEVIQTTENMKYLVLASYLEIYNEEIRDLLGADAKKKMDLKEHPDKGVYVQGLSQHHVHNTAECETLMAQGWNNRATGATLMNADSSRSHSIFTVTLEMMDTEDTSDNTIRSGKINLVDLAGSERQAKTGATGDRLKEATKINLSLSALSNVISALVDGKSKHIPYRDSKLTRLLQDSLGGNTKTLMVACLSPADNNYDETISTLRYANRAKNIKNKPKINEDPKDAMLREYQDEIRKLKEMLEKQGPQETRGNQWATRVEKQVVSMAVDEEALEEERAKVREEYEEKMRKMKEEMEEEQKNNQLLQANVDNIKRQYELELEKVNDRIQKEREEAVAKAAQQAALQRQTQQQQQSILVNGLRPRGDDDDDNVPEIIDGVEADVAPMGEDKTARANNTPTENAPDMMNTMQKQALKRLKQLQEQMVGGEQTQNKELKAKRMKRKKYMEKRLNVLSEALKNVDDEDGIMLKVYDDIHEELKAKTDLTKKHKTKIKSLHAEIRDLSEEFQEERTDYLETIRKQEQQVKLLQVILDKIQPTIRRDCNYSNLDTIKKEAQWEDEYQRWRVPDLVIIKTKLPPAGPSSTVAQSELLNNKYNINLSNSYNNSYSSNNNIQPGGRMSSQQFSQTAPPRLGMWDDENDSKFKKKLEKGEEEDIAGSYFKPKRANELLVRFQDDVNDINKSSINKKSSTGNGLLNMSMSQSMWGNQLNLNSSFNNSQGSYNSSWGSNSSTSSLDRGNGFSSLSPEMTNRKLPTRLEALPSLDRKNRKKSRDVLHTLDLI
ncbi:unnamed protein product [Meganyctiphanes norvegica]|uniref:Kinesin-like protein n=1 Tax=Meganyctiphanes norvegica TaxID=48144 RepID=A0AAV2QK79_MEGNR